MKAPSLVFYVVEATSGRGMSVRLDPSHLTATGFKLALEPAGFKVGDCVRMTLAPKRLPKKERP